MLKEINQYQCYRPMQSCVCVFLDHGISDSSLCNCCRNGNDTSCGSDCSCEREWFEPVCGVDDLTYFSPCYAGCQNSLGVTVSYLGLLLLY